MNNTDSFISDPRKIPIIMLGVMLGLFLAALDGTIVSTVMPVIIQDLQGMEYYVWPFAVYMLTSTMAIVIFGKCSDQFGRKSIFLLGIGIFLAGSLLCGIATEMIWFILFRSIQGIGGGILTTLAFIIVAGMFPIYERGKYIGFLVSVYGIASVAGPVLGGFISEVFGWRWAFYVNLPLGLIAIFIIQTRLPETAVIPENRDIDWAGIVFFIGGMIPLFIAVSCGGSAFDWFSLQLLGMLAISAILIALFIRTEMKATYPILPLQLFGKKVFTYTAIAAFMVSALLNAGIIYLPLFMQGVQKISAGRTGLIITPMVFALVIASTVAGRIITSTRRYKPSVIGGFIILGGGILMLATLTPASSLTFIVIASILLGYGTGTLLPVLAIAAQNALPAGDLGVVISSQQFFRNMGSTLLTPVFGLVMYAGLGKQVNRSSLTLLPPETLAYAIQLVFIFCILIVALSVVLMLRLEDIPLRSREC